MGDAIGNLGLAPRAERVEVPGGAVDRVFAPESAEALAEVVRAAVEDRAGLLVFGGRTRLGWANPARSLSLGLSTAGLAGVLEFEPDEGVIHAGAGTPLATLREVVAAEGWELPLDSPGPTTTVGGTISSAVEGPRAHAFGPVKDAILGLAVVGGDGVATRCGGRVVKNVTGYDLAKLYCGSFGSLAIVTSAWLRLRPVPAVRVELAGRGDGSRETLEALRAFAGRPSVRALVWRAEAPGGDGVRLLVELGGGAESVAADRAALEAIVRVDEAEPGALDREREARARIEASVGVRARVLGSRLFDMLAELSSAGLDVSADVGRGTLHATGELPDPTLAARLRETSVRFGGHLRVEAMPPAWLGEVDTFGDLGGTESIVLTLKRRFDPAGVLNPGRFVAEPREGAHA